VSHSRDVMESGSRSFSSTGITVSPRVQAYENTFTSRDSFIRSAAIAQTRDRRSRAS
jgi:hypothetical protein